MRLRGVGDTEKSGGGGGQKIYLEGPQVTENRRDAGVL